MPNHTTALPSFLSPPSQDTALLSYVVQALYTSPSDPEVFQRLLLALLTVSKSHPQNLIQLLDGDRLKEFCTAKKTPPKEDIEGDGEKKRESPSPDMEQDFLTKLNAVFWELIEQTPATPAVTSVATPGTAHAACQPSATILPTLHPPRYHRRVCYAM